MGAYLTHGNTSPDARCQEDYKCGHAVVRCAALMQGLFTPVVAVANSELPYQSALRPIVISSDSGFFDDHNFAGTLCAGDNCT